MPGQVIFLNGTSSAGKTSLARAIQEASPDPYLHVGIDSIFAMVPDKWGGGRGGPLSWDGFRYDRTEHAGAPLVIIRYGMVGRAILEAAYHSIALLPSMGQNVIVDEMLLSPDLMPIWTECLTGLDVRYVGVHCSLPELERRERERNNPSGLARGHLRTVHSHGVPYDIELDTTTTPAAELAAHVLDLTRTVTSD